MNAIGIDVGGTQITAGVVEDGNVTRVMTEYLDERYVSKRPVGRLADIILGLNYSDYEGVGIALPGIIDKKDGEILYLRSPHSLERWVNKPLKEELEKKFKVPFSFDNDGNCFASAEKQFGLGQDYDNIVGITLGTGFGLGVIANGQLYSGNNCGAGEFGSMPFREKELTHYCSGKFFKNFQDDEGRNGTGKGLHSRAEKGDEVALQAFREYGRNVGAALAMVLRAYDPEAIIIGGSISKARKFFEDSMRGTLRNKIPHVAYDRLDVKFSVLENMSVMGAASLCYSLNNPVTD